MINFKHIVRQKLSPSRLSLEVLLCFLIASITAVGLYQITDYFANKIILERFTNTQAISDQTEQELASFQEYITVNNLSTNDIKAIEDWIYGEKYVLMSVYKDEYLIYSNYPGYVKNVYSYMYKGNKHIPLYQRLHEVTFSDDIVQVGMYTLAATKIYDTAQMFELGFAFTVFIVIFLVVLTSKFKYISKLQNEMVLIGSGNLDLPMTIKGHDEISFLARSIDEMRKSFIVRIKNEDEARSANSELITSISHDLRTPLTILIGNLDLIASKKYNNEEQLAHYINNCRNKAYQLKELTDKLFEYFLVFGSEFQKTKLDTIDGPALISQLISEYSLSLEDQGFIVNTTSDMEPCFIEADMIAVRRVFDNLFSNIVKYAVPGSIIDIRINIKDSMLYIRMNNLIKEPSLKVERTNIGLATCEKIMAHHGGLFSVEKTEQNFNVTIGFPIKH